jgi:hypothetical protein
LFEIIIQKLWLIDGKTAVSLPIEPSSALSAPSGMMIVLNLHVLSKRCLVSKSTFSTGMGLSI